MRKTPLFVLIISSVMGLLFLGLLKVADLVIVARSSKQAVAVVDLNQPRLTMNTLDVYPYDGAHTQADFIIAESGGALWAGDHGFFIDFDLDRPPAKEPNEIRVIKIGGSGAAGWGAQNNYNMVYHQLEKKFNERRPCGSHVWLRMINLAMGGTHSYQNFIALNRWAHPLRPDLILAYPGNNDLYVTLTTHGDVYYGYPTVAGFVEVSRFSESPGWMKVVGRVYPGLMRETGLGLALRSLALGRYGDRGTRKYLGHYPDLAELGGGFDLRSEAQLAVYLENVTKPLVVHAFKSMKRDFGGIPIMIAWQAYMLPLDHPLDASIDVTIPVPVYWRLYENLRRSAVQALRGYINDDWHFFDTHEYYHAHLARRFPPGDGVHLSDDKAAVISDVLADEMFPRLCRIHERRRGTAGPADDGPVFYGDAPGPPPAPVAWQERAGETAIVVDGQAHRLSSGTVGSVESVIRVPGGTRFTGWAIDQPATKAAASVVILAEGRLIGRAAPSTPRVDMANVNPGFARSGWELVVPADGSLHGAVRLFALLRNGTARELAYTQPFPFATAPAARR
jgi:hypothetical protein